MGEGRHLGGSSITAIAAYALAFALTICAAPFLASVAFLAQVAACALGMLLDFVGNLSDANLVATENADYYADCLNWLQARLKRIAFEMRKLSFRVLTARDLAESSIVEPPHALRNICPIARQIGRTVT